MKNSIAKTTSILVIEDDPYMLQLLERILETEGYDVYLAADGVYGMSVLRETRPDLVLLDIMMPGPDGYQVLDSIRHYSEVPVIMVTAKTEVDSVENALSMGADDYIRKPFRPQELVARVKTKLRRCDRLVTATQYTGNAQA